MSLMSASLFAEFHKIAASSSWYIIVACRCYSFVFFKMMCSMIFHNWVFSELLYLASWCFPVSPPVSFALFELIALFCVSAQSAVFYFHLPCIILMMHVVAPILPSCFASPVSFVVLHQHPPPWHLSRFSTASLFASPSNPNSPFSLFPIFTSVCFSTLFTSFIRLHFVIFLQHRLI